ncbi:MAG: hypothetical protein ABIR30_06270 [Chitinophagaceae bacterium]
MKKIILIVSLLFTAGATAVFANNDPQPDEEVLNMFKKEFTAAENVIWSRQGEYDKATFLLAGHRVVAWFNPATTQLEGSIREIFFDQLPLTVMTAIDRKFPEAEISNVKEINNSEGTSYKVLLQSNKKRYYIKVGPGGNINEVEKLTK